MIKSGIFVFLISFFLDLTVSIVLPTQEAPKSTYTSGIKTRNWRNAGIQTHQNYSRVSVHNNPSLGAQYVLTLTKKTEKVYPIFNGHSYGQRFESQQHIEDNSQQGSETVENTRPIYKRKIEYNTLAIYKTCPEAATGLYVYYLSCNQYLNCWKGKGTVQNCSPGTLFNPRTLECDYPEKVDCITGPRANDIGNIRVVKSLKQATCPTGFNGIIPNYHNCSKFINCNNGQPTEMDCPPGTLFDVNNNLCDFPYKVSCFNGGSEYTSIGEGQYNNCYPPNNCVKSGIAYQTQDQQIETGSQFGSGSNHFGIGQVRPIGQAQVLGVCNPLIQNCSSSAAQEHSYSFTQSQCNPQTQNCPQKNRQGQNYQHIDRRPVNFNSKAYDQSQCDPQRQNCRQNIGQSLNYPTTNYQNTGQRPINFNFPTYGHSPCNPLTQNCGQRQNHPSIDQTTNYQISAQRPINSHLQTYGQSECNPQLQDCGQNYLNVGSHGTNFKNTGQRPVDLNLQGQVRCNPRIQNCGQNYLNVGSQDINYGNVGQHPIDDNSEGEIPCQSQAQGCGQYNGQNICNPQTQNCGQAPNPSRPNSQPGYGQKSITGYGETSGQNIGDGLQTASPSKCNPFLQNCPNSQYRKTANYTRTAINNSQNIKHNCNPSLENCSSDLTPDYVRSYSDCTTAACIRNRTNVSDNYNRICNINDSNCLQGYPNSVQKPKCPKDFQGITKHPTDCKKFLNCANGITFIQDCAPGTLFNPVIGNCDFPYNVDCEDANSESTETSYTTPYYDDSWKAEYDENSEKYRQNSGHGNVRVVSTRTPIASRINWGGANHDQKSVMDINQGQIGLINRPQITTARSINDQNVNKFSDYIDVFDPKDHRYHGVRSTTARSVSAWPPPFPSTDTNADYVFEYEDGEPVTLEPDNIYHAENKKKTICDKGDFYCTSRMCITKTMVCDGHRDCENGRDEQGCEEYIGRFTLKKNYQLNVLEKERWINVSYSTCALLCIENTHFNCRSFNYRNMDNTCFLSDTNVGLSGALRRYQPYDYYELITGTVDCSDTRKYFECPNKKCIVRGQLCDGVDDCGDRRDEKGCKPGDFGYSINLAGSKESNEGRVEVTAFGNTGYICDDQFGLRDANVICRELGFELGAADIKGQSFFARDLKEKDTLYIIDDLECFGNETSIIDCGFAGWGVHDCQDQEIAGVICKTPQEICGNDQWKCDTGNECLLLSFVCDGVNDCSDNSDEAEEHCDAPTQMRLVNGSSQNQGRVEITHYGMWGTVCDDDFNEDAAKVVCKHLGYHGSGIVKKNSYYGSGNGPIWLDQVSCYGNETELKECTNWDWGAHNCDHTEDVGVICINETETVAIQRNTKFLQYFAEDKGLPAHCGYRQNNQFIEEDSIHARVVSGFQAKKGDYPWQAAIRVKARDKTAHWCGAVIISSKWVISAAHCLQGYAKGAYIIVAGDYNIDEDEGTEQQKYIDEYYIHEDFRKGHKMNNDIALIRLKSNGFVLNDNVQPICLPESDTIYDMDLNCTISGFGSVKSGIAAYSHKMMAAWIPIHSNDICKMPHIYNNSLTEGMFCAGSLDGGTDACDGDSGGPLACLDQGLFTLYGLTSWGHHCGYANKPGVYVKVSNYRKWIDGIIKKHWQ